MDNVIHETPSQPPLIKNSDDWGKETEKHQFVYTNLHPRAVKTFVILASVTFSSFAHGVIGTDNVSPKNVLT